MVSSYGVNFQNVEICHPWMSKTPKYLGEPEQGLNISDMQRDVADSLLQL